MEVPVEEEPLKIDDSKIITTGTRRRVYCHPDSPDKVIKVFWEDQLPAKRRATRWDRWFKSLLRFDDNENDYRQYTRVRRRFDHAIYCVYRIYGYVNTTLGRGLVAEHVRNIDGTTSETLADYVRKYGRKDILPALDKLFDDLAKYHVVAKDPHVENILVRVLEGEQLQLVVIDGLGDNNVIPFASISRKLNQRKLMRKKQSLLRHIDRIAQRARPQTDR